MQNGHYFDQPDDTCYAGSINLHKGKKWWYWFVSPAEKPVKLPAGERPDSLSGKRVEMGAERRKKRSVLGNYY